ncbi:MAG: hypothetical protein H0X38_11730, partial [Planctomycetes bacterium]|nr:hypothetical protein [Planctomycetota bacterium]
PTLARWLAEPPPPLIRPGAWRGERVLTLGSAAYRWLDLGASAPVLNGPDDPAVVFTRAGLIQEHAQRARSAGELALMMRYDEQLEGGDLRPLPGAAEIASPLLGHIIPAMPMILHLARADQARHVLVRLAVRLQLLGKDGHLPRTHDEAVKAVGRLICPYGDATLPVTYQFLAEHAFRLFLSDQDPAPATISAQRWKALCAPVNAPPGRHLVVPGKVLEVVIDPHVPPEERKGADGF